MIIPRPFDFTRFRTRKIALRFAYLGFVVPEGLVQQKEDDGTVEQLLLSAAAKTCLMEAKGDDFSAVKTAADYSLCGRTDKGVSGLGNVMALTLRSNAKQGEEFPSPEDEIKYTYLMNRVLPPGVRVLGWAPVADDFSARFNCEYRAYKYFFVGGDLDIKAMQEACAMLVGEHDYRNLCTMDVGNVTHFNRRILETRIKPAHHSTSSDPRFQMYEFYVKGTAFLYHQVRCMMSVLFMVGKHLESPMIVSSLLDVAGVPRKPQYHIASDVPLVLYDTGFSSTAVPWHRDQNASRATLKHFTELFVGQFSLQTAVVQCVIDTLRDNEDDVDDDRAAPKHIKLMDRQKEETYEQRRASYDRRLEEKIARNAKASA